VNVNYQYDGIYMSLLRLYRGAWAEVWELEKAVIDHGYSGVRGASQRGA